ncbi:hypothetical protein D934_08930 [Xylella fastidiosa subsp. sandyi Ann-1]|uniref:Uncharacterized protein n=1 Tax=Xylella fastidiosa subsp. sandyi Ann-1 TaxID=155920 RepID=A0A060H7Y0_XYLFS|nr:hypothetical protein D934_07710 [Xylella fastidiosa subsp. sandyi Ann-1]AIC11395.1 hypothetical protein D934_08930 [Xylella fastidiosa subsp. sandyi Ann-1]
MIRRDTVRLKVTYGAMHTVTGGPPLECVEVTNLSYLAVTVTEVAFQKGPTTDKRSPIVGDCLGRIKLPLRLRPRCRFFIAVAPAETARLKGTGLTHVRAVTACGVKAVSPIRRGQRWFGVEVS